MSKLPKKPKKSSGQYHVAPEQANQTILAALRKWLGGKSWNDLRKLLRSRHITINGNLCLDEGRRVQPKEVIKVLEHPAAPPPKDQDVRIRFFDAHMVVVEKPAGMTTLRHSEERAISGRRKQLQPTLDEVLPRILQKKLPAAQSKKQTKDGRFDHSQKRGERPRKGNDDSRGLPRRLRAVHRLDRDTSGVMLFARTFDAEQHLGQQFRNHTVHRVYLAVVRGDLNARTFESSLIPDRGDGRRGTSRNPKEGKWAVTHVRPVEKLNGYTVIECRLETGRTHQIRIHLSEAGFPICGDKVYRGPYAQKPVLDESGAPRLALHAAEIGFIHPVSNEEMKFAMPLPPELHMFLTRLRTKKPKGNSGPKRASEPEPEVELEAGDEENDE